MDKLARDTAVTSDHTEPYEVVESHQHEKVIERVGIKALCCLDVMDSSKMESYLKTLRATSGSPEEKLLEKRQQRWLANNAVKGKSQRQLTHRELHEYSAPSNRPKVKPQRLKSIVGYIKNRFVKKHGARKPETNSMEDFILSPQWRMKSAELPPLGQKIRKIDRDKIYNFDTLFRQVIFNFIDQVGQLPASESHHHNWPGGLLQHSLEVADMSFQFAKSQDIEIIGLNDIEAQRRGPWQYAAFIIGLLHDVGKSVTDMNVHALKPNGDTVRWNPSLTTLNQFLKDNGCLRYFVDMNPTTRYVDGSGRFKRHEGMASVMLERILTPEAIHYITSSPDTGFGLWEQITSILSGKSSHHYLETSLKQAEQLSVYRSFTKARSSFHLKDRRRSVAEVYIEQLHYLRKDANFLKHVFNIGGAIFIRYPEGLNMIQNELKNSPSAGAFVANYKPNEILNFLESAAYVKRANESRSIVRIIKTKIATSKKNTVSYEPAGGAFTAVMLEHPTLLFGNDRIPDAISAIVYISEQKAIEFFSETDCQEYVESAENSENKKHKSRKGDVANMLDSENKWNIVSHNIVELEDSDTQGESKKKNIAGQMKTVQVDANNNIVSIDSNSENEEIISIVPSQEAKATGSNSKPVSSTQRKIRPSPKRAPKTLPEQTKTSSLQELDSPPSVQKIPEDSKKMASKKSSKDTLFDNSKKDTTTSPKEFSEPLVRAFAAWSNISEINTQALESCRIPILLFNAPFFSDRSKEFGSEDWASSGEHIARKNDRTVVLKQAFVDQVIATMSQDKTTSTIEHTKNKHVPNETFEKSEQPVYSQDSDSLDCKQALLMWAESKPENMTILKSGEIPSILMTSGLLKDLGITVERLKKDSLLLATKGRKVKIDVDWLKEQAESVLREPLNNVVPQKAAPEEALTKSPDTNNAPPNIELPPIDAYQSDNEHQQVELPMAMWEEEPIAISLLDNTSAIVDHEIKGGEQMTLTKDSSLSKAYDVSIDKNKIASLFDSKAEMGNAMILVKSIKLGQVFSIIPGIDALDIEYPEFQKACLECLTTKMQSNACPKISDQLLHSVIDAIWMELQINDVCTLEILSGD